MEQSESDEDLNKNLDQFNKIVKNYRDIQDNLANTNDDINKLEKVHVKFVSHAENKIRFHEYGTYIDDIYYQINLLKMEYNCQQTIQTNNINKLYKDLYRLYNKIVKKLISVRMENNNITMLIDKKHVLEKMQQEKKQFFTKVKKFDELSDAVFIVDDCVTLYNEVELRLQELMNSIQDITNAIKITEEQTTDGLLLQTFLISLQGEKEKTIIEHDVFEKLLNGILLSHIDISKKYLNRTNIISKEIINDTEKLKII
jgi:hypothetical protein